MIKKMARLQGPEDGEGGDLGGGSGSAVTDAGIDLDSAMAEISEGLGFSADKNEDLDNDKADPDATGAQSTTSEAEKSGVQKEDPPAGETKGTADPKAATGNPSPPPKPGDLPDTWKPDLKAKWEALDPDVKAEVYRRENDIVNGLKTYKETSDFGKAVQRSLAPFLPTMQRFGIDPAHHMGVLAGAHQTLALGTPEQKVGKLIELARGYGIDMSKAFTPADPNEGATYEAPEVANLRAQNQALESRLAALETGRHSEVQQRVAGEVEKFSSDPKNEFFTEVAPEMTRLLQSGVCATIAEAYDKAVYLVPEVRAQLMQREATAKAQADAKAELEKRQADDARAKAALKARGANIRSSAKSNSGAAGPKGTMDDTLAETLANIESRENGTKG